MYTIAYHLQKGGVGKSTLSVSTAWELSRVGKTLLVDSDPQGNTSTWLLGGRDFTDELADVLFERTPPGAAILELRDGLYILPTFGIGGELKDYAEDKLSRYPKRFSHLLREIQELGFDFVVFDLSPGMSQLERTILSATDEIVIPIMPDIFSIGGLDIFTESIGEIEKGFEVELSIRRMVVNGYDKRIGQHVEVYNGAKRTRFELFTVGVDPVFRKSQAEHLPAQEITGRDRMKAETRREIERLSEAIAGGK